MTDYHCLFCWLGLGIRRWRIIASIEERRAKELRIDIEDNPEPQRECCIYRVPRGLRKINEEAYTPNVISVGPLHHGTREFVDMENQKIIYKRKFRKRVTEETWKTLINFLEKNEGSIRNCYEETCKLQEYEFIAMIPYDAVFIIELFLRAHEHVKDFLLRKPQLRAAISLDLQLLENQLPYFVLKELYLLAFPDHPIAHERSYPSFFDISCRFLNCKGLTGIAVEEEVRHFTDLRRFVMTKMYQVPKSKEFVKDLTCAVKLQESRVKFKCKKSNCLLEVKLENQKRMIPCLGEPELQIPRIKVYDQTEALFRNVMALEQCHYPLETKVCNLIVLMDFLINTTEDIDLLAEAKILSNNLGDSSRVARMFNKLCLQIIISKPSHHDIAEKLKKHHDNSWNRTKATLRSVYFRNLWRGTGTCAATLLLLLAIIQTACSILQV